jgi:hypothetical protein
MAKGGGKITVKGMDVLQKRLAELPEVVQEAARRAVHDETEDVAAQMIRDAPYDTGYLAHHIQTEFSDEGLTGKAASTADYSKDVVYGTSTHKAVDFMTPASETSRRRFPERVKRYLGEALRKVGE